MSSRPFGLLEQKISEKIDHETRTSKEILEGQKRRLAELETLIADGQRKMTALLPTTGTEGTTTTTKVKGNRKKRGKVKVEWVYVRQQVEDALAEKAILEKKIAEAGKSDNVEEISKCLLDFLPTIQKAAERNIEEENERENEHETEKVVVDTKPLASTGIRKRKRGDIMQQSTLTQFIKTKAEPIVFEKGTAVLGENQVCPKCQSGWEYYKTEDVLRCSNASCGYVGDAGCSSSFSGMDVRNDDKGKYQPMHHFNERLRQFTASESTDIPEYVYESLKREIAKYPNLLTKGQITVPKICEFLKHLGLSKFYEHAHFISLTFNNVRPIEITSDQEKILCQMFEDIQVPFHMYCRRPRGTLKSPATRRRNNMMSYTYLFYKFCQLKGWDYLLPHFKLLKSWDNLLDYDCKWRKICNYLHWEFLPTPYKL